MLGAHVRRDLGLPGVRTVMSMLSADSARSVRTFKATLEAVKLRTTFRAYDLRHTTASLQLAEGEPVTAVAEGLGHGSPAISLAVYSHALPSHKARKPRTCWNCVLTQNP